MFLDDCKVTFEAPTAAGTSTIDSAAYDIANFDGICFVVRFGTPAANNNIRLRQDVATGGSYADLAGSLVNDAVKNTHILDLNRAGKQFIKCRITRGTSTTIDGLAVIQYRGRRLPVTQPTSVAKQLIAPAEGTA